MRRVLTVNFYYEKVVLHSGVRSVRHEHSKCNQDNFSSLQYPMKWEQFQVMWRLQTQLDAIYVHEIYICNARHKSIVILHHNMSANYTSEYKETEQFLHCTEMQWNSTMLFLQYFWLKYHQSQVECWNSHTACRILII